MRLVANFVLFQIGWFACVLGGAHGRPWLGPAVALPIVGWHLARAARPGPELVLVVLAGAIGAAFDSALVATRWVDYASGTLVDGAAPYWMVVLWMLFATTLNVSLRWLRGRPLAGVALGAIGGPLAYWGGARLGGVVFLQPAAATAAIAVGWALLTPLLVGLAQRCDGCSSTPEQDAAAQTDDA
jgi:hypothetical protein